MQSQYEGSKVFRVQLVHDRPRHDRSRNVQNHYQVCRTRSPGARLRAPRVGAGWPWSGGGGGRLRRQVEGQGAERVHQELPQPLSLLRQLRCSRRCPAQRGSPAATTATVELVEGDSTLPAQVHLLGLPEARRSTSKSAYSLSFRHRQCSDGGADSPASEHLFGMPGYSTQQHRNGGQPAGRGGQCVDA